MNEIILNYHPRLKNLDDNFQRDDLFIILSPEDFRTDQLVEETISHVGGIEHTPEVGRDHGDDSDTKTVSMNLKTPKRGRVEITGVEKKIGALRIVIFNPIVQRLHYMFLPFESWNANMQNAAGSNRLKKRIVFYYDIERDRYEWNQKSSLEDWRFEYFVDFAQMSPSNTLYNNVELVLDDEFEFDI